MKRILLAEGHRPTRELVGQRLADEGYEVLPAETHEAGYESFASLRPEAAVVAADLPLVDGEHLARRLRRADPRLVLVVTDRAHLGRAVGVRAVLDLQANAYVADPTSRELPERLALLLSQAGAARPPAGAVGQGMARILSRPPAEQGEIRPGLVADLLHRLWRAGADGILRLRRRDRVRTLFLWRGAPIDFDSDLRGDTLGRWLVDTGAIGEEQYRASLDSMAADGLSAGGGLVACGAIEAGEPLRHALRGHLRAMVARCVAQREGRWSFFSGAEFRDEVQSIDVAPLAGVLQGARIGLPVRFFAQDLRAWLGDYPARTPEFQRLLQAMALSTEDLRLALGLDGQRTARAFLEGCRTDLTNAFSLLWFLRLTGAVAFHPEPVSRPEGDLELELPAPPRRQKPLPEERAEEIRRAALQVLPGSYFKALGLDIAAGTEEVERAYHEVASRFHPDAFAEFEVEDLADLLAQVQDKVNAAYRVLSVPDKRKAYLSHLLARQSGEGRRRTEVDPEAEVALKRGERALKERRFTEAVGALREASERNPREPEYLAVLALALLRDSSLRPEERLAAASRAARRAVALDPECGRALVAMALAEEASGDLAEARKRLLAALKADPDNELARRALQRLSRPRA